MSPLRWHADRTNTLTELRPLPKEFTIAERTRDSVEPGFEAGRIHLQSAINVYSRRRQILNCWTTILDKNNQIFAIEGRSKLLESLDQNIADAYKKQSSS